MSNTVLITGRLARDPHTFANGGCAVTVADNRKEKKEGEWVDVTEWHEVIINAPWIAKYVSEAAKKGMNVSLRGHLQYRPVKDMERVKEARIVIEGDGFFEIIWPPRERNGE